MTGPPIGSPVAVQPIPRTGAAGWSSQAASQAASSVFAVPLRSERPDALEAAAQREGVIARIDLIHPVDQGDLLGVEFRRLPAEVARAEHEVLLDEIAHTRSQRRPEGAIVRDREDHLYYLSERPARLASC